MNNAPSPQQIWIKKAEEDFTTALLNAAHAKHDYAAFLFQQAAEKALKAVLIKKGQGVIKTHDCFGLAKMAEAPREIVQHAEILTPFYSRTRYPDANIISVDKQDAERLKKACIEVITWSKKNC